jgi:uncharacterized protein (TIGR02271 family)
MISAAQVRDVIGRQVVDASGSKIGRIGQVYLDDQTGEPEWATVNTGLFGTNESFVPLAEAEPGNEAVRVPYSKDQVKDAPTVNPAGGHLDQTDEAQLYRHYGLAYSQGRSDSGLPEDGVGTGMTDPESAAGTVGRDTSGPTTDDAMTRSEERLRAGTERVTTGKARLRKYVETEEQQVSVPVTRERVRVEREPVTDANRDAAMAGPDISEEEHEVTLTEERPVVAKETVPVERVRLSKDVEQAEETVTEQVRKERIESDADIDPNSGRGGRSR